ncbi:TetR/AcrR family transcriptional regulator [Leifsonia sp. 2TAF2]|uniref:TetR/AcrR family transcriptional regulator n=1 Tax=Leifsonia sp. 2TAF2 TaxID=3233009 RepID=UPI003F97B1EF
MVSDTAQIDRDAMVDAKPLNKRDRLVSGARRVIYERGVERTSLAHVAEAAGVPVGNIYYYFKTKDDLVAAAVAAQSSESIQLFQRLEQLGTPTERLHGLLDVLVEVGGSVAEYGCPLGTLSAELDKRNGTMASPESQRLLVPMIDWAEQQFADMACADARQQAITLIAAYEGAALLTHSLRDPDVLRSQMHQLHVRVDELNASLAQTDR